MSRLDRFRTRARLRHFERDGKHFVERDGRIIEIVSVNGDPPAPAFGKGKDFARIELAWAAAVAKATNSPSFAVKVALAYMAWKTKSQTFVLSNSVLERLGVNRENKRRALARLEKDGVIQIERQGFRAPVVTLLIRTE